MLALGHAIYSCFILHYLRLGYHFAIIENYAFHVKMLIHLRAVTLCYCGILTFYKALTSRTCATLILFSYVPSTIIPHFSKVFHLEQTRDDPKHWTIGNTLTI